MQRPRVRQVLLGCVASLFAFVFSACSGWTQGEPGDELEVRLTPLPFNPSDTLDHGNAALQVVALYQLHGNRPEFGGFSGMVLEGDTLVAVSDHGYWWRSRLELGPQQKLLGLRDSRLGPLYDLDSRPLRSARRRDSEELARWPGGLLVSFEGDHRVVFYRRRPAKVEAWRALTDRRPARLITPSDLLLGESNGGIEAMTRLADGRLLLFSESRLNDAGNSLAWIGAPSARQWQRVAVAVTEDFKSTSATTLPDGDVLLLQRSYRPEVGVRARICRIGADELSPLPSQPGQRIEPLELLRLAAPRNVDNFESIDILATPEGRLFVFILSDENYSAQQRTLLLQLELVGAGLQRG